MFKLHRTNTVDFQSYAFYLQCVFNSLNDFFFKMVNASKMVEGKIEPETTISFHSFTLSPQPPNQPYIFISLNDVLPQ